MNLLMNLLMTRPTTSASRAVIDDGWNHRKAVTYSYLMPASSRTDAFHRFAAEGPNSLHAYTMGTGSYPGRQQ